MLLQGTHPALFHYDGTWGFRHIQAQLPIQTELTSHVCSARASLESSAVQTVLEAFWDFLLATSKRWWQWCVMSTWDSQRISNNRISASPMQSQRILFRHLLVMANLRHLEPWEVVSSAVTTAVEAVICLFVSILLYPIFLTLRQGQFLSGSRKETGFNGLILVYLISFIFLSFLILSSPKAYWRIPVRSKSFFESWKLK